MTNAMAASRTKNEVAGVILSEGILRISYYLDVMGSVRRFDLFLTEIFQVRAWSSRQHQEAARSERLGELLGVKTLWIVEPPA